MLFLFSLNLEEANVFCGALILYFHLSSVRRTVWVRFAGGVGLYRWKKWVLPLLCIPLFLSPSSLLHLFSEKNQNYFLLKGPVVVGCISVTACPILLTSRKEMSCCVKRLWFPSLVSCPGQRKRKNLLPCICTCAFFLHYNVLNKLPVQAQNENIMHVTLVPSKNKCLSVFVLYWRSAIHGRLNASWDSAGFVAMCSFQ